jgi:hypothetical protein
LVYSFTHILLSMGEKMLKGSQSSPFLAINAKGGESIKPKAKGPHHHLVLKTSFQDFFQLVTNYVFN